MQLTFDQPYLSIKSLPESEIPAFCIITGPNGSGKTHLLKAIKAGKVKLVPRSTSIEYFDWTTFKQSDTQSADRPD